MAKTKRIAARGTNGNVRADTYERLKQAIIDNEYRPGEIVGISELARDLGVSRTPIREALSILERDFLVKLVDMRGVIIRPLTVDEIIQLNQMREVIDGLAARLAALTMADEEIEHFKAEFQALAADPELSDSETHARLSEELHAAITAACGNSYVQSQWLHLNTAFLRAKKQGWGVWTRSVHRAEISRRRLDEHLRIIEGLEKRDPGAAETAARAHISNATSDLLKLMRGQA